jgi:hypothetical protein
MKLIKTSLNEYYSKVIIIKADVNSRCRTHTAPDTETAATRDVLALDSVPADLMGTLKT